MDKIPRRSYHQPEPFTLDLTTLFLRAFSLSSLSRFSRSSFLPLPWQIPEHNQIANPAQNFKTYIILSGALSLLYFGLSLDLQLATTTTTRRSSRRIITAIHI